MLKANKGVRLPCSAPPQQCFQHMTGSLTDQGKVPVTTSAWNFSSFDFFLPTHQRIVLYLSGNRLVFRHQDGIPYSQFIWGLNTSARYVVVSYLVNIYWMNKWLNVWQVHIMCLVYIVVKINVELCQFRRG